MSWMADIILGVHNWYHNVPQVKATLEKSTTPITFGILSAAAINHAALIDPVQTHPDVEITAIAARSLDKAQAQITYYGVRGAKAYGSYAELLIDPEIDAVYIPLPNGLHAEWAIRAMEAGKHVLIEKPIASNGAEAKAIRDCAIRTGRVALEAFHWRFHPAAHTVKAHVDSGEYGAVQSVDVDFRLPSFALRGNDIRFNYDLAGGSCMDLTYVFSAATYFASPEMLQSSYSVLSATPRRNAVDTRIDDAMVAQFFVEYPGHRDVKCNISCALTSEKLWGWLPKYWDAPQHVVVELEKARITFPHFPGPWAFHSIVIEDKAADGRLTGIKRTKKAYAGGPLWSGRGARWWTTYRYQLEAFVEQIKKGPLEINMEPWVSMEESVKLMGLIDDVYEKAGMPKRGQVATEA